MLRPFKTIDAALVAARVTHVQGAGTMMPGSEGGRIAGGPLNGAVMPGSKGGTIVGGPLHGTVLPAIDPAAYVQALIVILIVASFLY